MTSLDANALTEDVRGLEFLAQTIGSGAACSNMAYPDMASRFGAKARSARVSLKTKTVRSVGDRRRMAAISELI